MDNVRTPFISVIIPAFNQGKFLESAIKSVLSQSFLNYEIIVVDDGSTDDTPAVAAQFGEKIRYIRQDNLGLAGARNTGIRAARGEWVGLLDSDDLWLSNYLEKVSSVLNHTPEAAVCYSKALCMDVNGHHLMQEVGYQPINGTSLYSTLLRANFIIPSTVTMRRSVVVDAGLFDHRFLGVEDWDLWLRLLQQKQVFVGIPEVLVNYRVHGSSLSANPARMQQSFRLLIESHFGIDDGQFAQWSLEKRRIYGGYYRYKVLTNIQRQNNWQNASDLRQSLRSDPTLKDDESFFYELALGNQPFGRRGTSEELNLRENAKFITILLDEVFGPRIEPELQGMRRQVVAMSWKALGMAAYNTNQFALSRKFIWMALRLYPRLIQDRLLFNTVLKSLFGKSGLTLLRGLRQGHFPVRFTR